MKVTQMPTAHAANLVANSGNTAYGADVIHQFDYELRYIQMERSTVTMIILGGEACSVKATVLRKNSVYFSISVKNAKMLQ